MVGPGGRGLPGLRRVPDEDRAVDPALRPRNHAVDVGPYHFLFRPARSPHVLPAADRGRLVPRPIAWVSSRSSEGVDNLAPHSFFTVACVDPPIVAFTSVGKKDSLRNIEQTGQFVVNFAPESMFEQINASGTDFAPGVERVRCGRRRTGAERPGRPVTGGRVTDRPGMRAAQHDPARRLDPGAGPGRTRRRRFSCAGRRPSRRRATAAAGPVGCATSGRCCGEIREISRIRRDDWPGHYAAELPDPRSRPLR